MSDELVELFVELADVEPVQDVIPSSQQYGVQDPYMEFRERLYTVSKPFFENKNLVVDF